MSRSSLRRQLTRAYGRYYCNAAPEGVLHRVFPYDGFERATEGPILGRRGGAVLLTTANAYDPNVKWAWCWACGQWRQCSRLTQHDLMLAYLRRPNVGLRVEGRDEEEELLNLAERAHRSEPIVVPMPRRRRAS